jgi:hypothetical protein
MYVLSNISKYFTTIERNYNDNSEYYVYFIQLINIINIILILLITFGMVVDFDNLIINKINSMIQMFICLVLVIKFHPFREHILHKNDASIIFGSALFLIVNLGIMEYANNIYSNIEKTVMNGLL